MIGMMSTEGTQFIHEVCFTIANIVACRIVGELVQASRGPTPDPPSKESPKMSPTTSANQTNNDLPAEETS